MNLNWRTGTWINTLSLNNFTLFFGTCVLGNFVIAVLVPSDSSLVHSISEFFSRLTSIFTAAACERRSLFIETWLINNCFTVTFVPSDSLWLQIQLRQSLDFSYSISVIQFQLFQPRIFHDLAEEAIQLKESHRWEAHRWRSHRWRSHRWGSHRWRSHRWGSHRWESHRWKSLSIHQLRSLHESFSWVGIGQPRHML